MASAITPRIVLSHTSGLYNWASSPTSDEWADSRIDFHFPVDECFSYSGEAYAFLQRAVESVTGKSLDEVDLRRGVAMDYFTNSSNGHEFCDEICRMTLGDACGIQAWIGYDDDL